jgi:hypothetical protein
MYVFILGNSAGEREFGRSMKRLGDDTAVVGCGRTERERWLLRAQG